MASRDRKADAEDCKNRGNECLQNKEFDKAIQWYTEALKLHEDHVYYSNRSAAYLSKNYADSALKDAEKCIQLAPDWAKGYSRKGAALHKLKQYEKAIDAYEKGLKLEPTNTGLISGLKAVKDEQENPFGSYGGSEDETGGSGMNGAAGGDPLGGMFNNIMQTVRNSPKLSKYLSDPSYIDMITKIQANPQLMTSYMNDPRMMETFTEMLGLDPEMMKEAKERKKEDDEKQKEKDKAAKGEREKKEAEAKKKREEEEFNNLSEEEQKIVVNKKKAAEHKDTGNNYYKEKKFREAIAEYDLAIALDPSNMSYLTNKAAVVLEEGDLEECIRLCEEAIKVGRENYADYELIAKAYARMGNAYYKHNKYDFAIEFYKKAQLEKKTQDVEKKLNLAEKKKKEQDERDYIDPEQGKLAKELGNEKFKNGDFPGAVKDYTEAVKRDPENAVYYSNRAAAYMKLADFGRAMDDCKKAIKLDSKFIKAYSRKGNIEIFLKEYHKAMDTFKLGLEIEPNNHECKEGLDKTMYLIQQSNYNTMNETEEERHARAQRAMEDPEIRNMLSDPVLKSILQEMQTDPKAGMKHMQNPEVASKIQKLIAAGIIQTR